MEDVWKQIRGFPNYKVHKTGLILNVKKNKLISLVKTKAGYINVGLWNNGKQKTFLLHRLIAEQFIPNPLNLPCVNHKNYNKEDNAIGNLEWCSYKDNNIHSIAGENGNKGAKVKHAKLSEINVKHIKNRLHNGEKLVILAKEFKVCKQTIWKIKENKIWKSIKGER